MTPPEAYRAGFFLKCAQLGLPVPVATMLYQQPEAVLKRANSSARAEMLKALQSGAMGLAKVPAHVADIGGRVGQQMATQVSDPAATKRLGLSQSAISDLLLAEHYNRARQALLPPATA